MVLTGGIAGNRAKPQGTTGSQILHRSLRGANSMVGTTMQPCRSCLIVSLEFTLKPVGKPVDLSPSCLPEAHFVK